MLALARRFALPALSLLFLAGQPPPAQQTAPNPMLPLDTHPLVEAALHSLDAAAADHARFTDFMQMQTITFLHPEAESVRISQLKVVYEQTWINDLPYDRLTEKNGKALTGPALAAEERRYDAAVAARQKLGIKEREKIDGYGHLRENGIDIHQILRSEYVLRESLPNDSSGSGFRIVEATLKGLPPAESLCPWHYTLSIKQNPTWLVSFRVDSPHSTKFPCRDASEEITYALVEGYPRMLRRHLVMFMPWIFGYQRVEDVYDYSKIRRFSASAKLKFEPDDVAPPTEMPPPATPKPR